MVISRTRTVDVIIQALSPLLMTRAAGAAAAGAAAGAAVCASDGSINSAAAARAGSPASPAPISFLDVMVELLFASLDMCGLQRRGVGFAGADADGVVDVVNEDFAVADLAGLGRSSDGLDDLVGLLARNSDFDLDLWQEIHGVFGTAIDFSMTLLTPVTFDLGDGQPVHPCRSQSVTDLVELERLDDGHDDFHGFDPRLGPDTTDRADNGSVAGSCSRGLPERRNSSLVPTVVAGDKSLWKLGFLDCAQRPAAVRHRPL